MNSLFVFCLLFLCPLCFGQSSVKRINFKVNSEADLKHLYTLIKENSTIKDVKLNVDLEDSCDLWKGKCYYDRSTSENPVLIRLYDNEEISKWINRTREAAIIEVAGNLNLTAKLIAKFDNGITVDFINGERSNRETLVPVIRQKLAQKLATLHSIKSLDNFVDKTFLLDKIEFYNIFLKNAKDNIDLLRNSTETFGHQLPRFSEINEEEKKLISWLHKLDALGPTVLSINTFLSDNILNRIIINSDTKTPYFQDLRRCNINYQSYDLAELFYQLDYDSSYPIPKELEIDFLRNYHQEFNRLSPACKDGSRCEKKLIEMTDNQFENFLENAYNKLQANKLMFRLARIGLLISDMITVDDEFFTKRNKKATIELYNQYRSDKKRIEQLFITRTVGSNTNSITPNILFIILCTTLVHYFFDYKSLKLDPVV